MAGERRNVTFLAHTLLRSAITGAKVFPPTASVAHDIVTGTNKKLCYILSLKVSFIQDANMVLLFSICSAIALEDD